MNYPHPPLPGRAWCRVLCAAEFLHAGNWDLLSCLFPFEWEVYCGVVSPTTVFSVCAALCGQ